LNGPVPGFADREGNLHGKVQFVGSFPDLTINVVDSFPDFTIQVVDAFGDFRARFVDALPGVSGTSSKEKG